MKHDHESLAMESGPVAASRWLTGLICLTGAALLALTTAARTADVGLNDVTFVVFDTETTGFSPYNDRVIEVGAVKYRNGKILESKDWLINPRREVPIYATHVHGITDEMLKDQPTFDKFYPEFEAFIGDSVLLAHNARFDVSFMREEIRRNEQALPPNPVLDTLKLFRRWFPESESHKLGKLARYLGVKGSRAFHRADADAAYLLLIMQKGMDLHPQSDTLDKLTAEAGGPLWFARTSKSAHP
jgi:DNA polymerase-3 subunit alpha (Gram-positive type)